MKHITMLDLRRDAEGIVSRVLKGERFVLTRRGKAVARLEPVIDKRADADDAFYALTDLAVGGESITNRQIDEAVYGR
jgi:antitoxin (DNA-binding transcriptional repressor) of toxin-antitoxin stability system